jgi:hypothetical protein
MSKLAEYLLVLSEDRAEHARYRKDKVQAMTQFGLTEAQQQIVLTGTPTTLRTGVLGGIPVAENVPIQTTPKPQPKPPKPPE